jgi:hypothetical protein
VGLATHLCGAGPPLSLGLVLGPAALLVASTALVASILLGNHNAIHHLAPWWPALMVTLAVMLACAVLPLRGRVVPTGPGPPPPVPPRP